MKTIIFVGAVCLYFGSSYGSEDIDGVGAFAYNGPDGRYGGTYGLKDGQVVNKEGNFPPNFQPPSFPDFDSFFPEYFYNLENQLQETNPFVHPSPFIRPFRRRFSKPFFKRTFDDSVENQKLAYAAATKAFDLTTNRAASNQYFAPSRFPFGGNFPGFDGFPGYQGPVYPGFGMSHFGRAPNSAYAGAAIGPDFMHHVADINPPNPNNPNINKFSSINNQPSGFKSVSSSSFASTASDSSGKRTETRRAETTINNNGVITKYKVES